MNPKTREHQGTNTMKILERDELTRTSKDDLPGEKKKVSNEVERKYKVAEGRNTQSSSDFLKISIFTANVCRLQITVSVFFDI